jgi:hypothetical protein
MKISFSNFGSGAGISIRAAINALLNWCKGKGTPTAARKKNVPQITSGWDYRPRESLRRRAAIDTARAETAKTLSSGSSAVAANNLVWFDFINPDPTIEHARTKKGHRGIAHMPVRRTTKVP